MTVKIINTIKTLKLTSGEEMIAKIVNFGKFKSSPDQQSFEFSFMDTADYLVVENPVSIAPGPNGGIGLVPSMFTAGLHEVYINLNNVTMISETDDSVQMKYIESITGIQVPDKKIILG
jgi:hypothetical protein